MPVGLSGFMGLGKETTWGTAVAATRYVPLVSESIVHTIEPVLNEPIAAVTQRLGALPGPDMVAGDVVFQARPTILGDFLRSAVGVPTTSTLTAGQSYKHTFIPRSAPFSAECWGNPYTLEIFKTVGASSHQFAGVVFSSLQFRFGARERMVQVTAAAIGRRKPTLITPTTPTLEGRNPFVWHQAQVQLPSPTQYKDFTDLTITLSWPLRGELVLDNTKEIGRLVPDGFMDVLVEGTVYPLTIDEWQQFQAQSERSLVIVIDSNVNIGSSTDKYKITFTIPKFVYHVYDYGLSGPGQVTATFRGAGYYDSTTGGAVKVELQNELSGY